MGILAPSLTMSVRARIQNDIGQPVKPGFTTENLQTWLDALKRTDDKVEAVQKEEQKILTDRGLSDEGKSKALAALAQKSIENFAFLGRQVSQAEDAGRRLEQLLYGAIAQPPKESETKQLIRELRAAEIRANHEGENPDTVFLLALEKGDLETAQALLLAPGGSLVRPDTLERGKTAYATRTNENAYNKLQAVQFLQEHLASLADHISQWLIRLGAKADAVAETVKVAA